jgi:outer membrane autotransporter protein
MVAKTMKRPSMLRTLTTSLERSTRVGIGTESPRRWLKTFGIKRQRLAAALSLTLTAGLTAASLHAMNIHVNGNQVILSGDVVYTDLYVLADVVDRLRTQGRQIDTLVMRNSRGGSTYGGYDIGDFARRNHLTTVVSGYCISACSMMFVGGSNRAFAADQPVWNQYIGIHGQSLGDDYLDSSEETPFYKYFIQAIADGDITKTDKQLIDDAFSDHGAAVAYLYDPAAKKVPSVYWCHSSCNNPAQYKAYPNDTVYNLGFITQQEVAKTTDTLIVTKDVSGNINPNYYNPYDPEAKSYLNERLMGLASEWNPFASHLAPDIGALLTKEAYLDDVEVQLYNHLAPEDRKRLWLQFVREDFLSGETLGTYNAHLLNPSSRESYWVAQIKDFSARPFVDPDVLSTKDSFGVIKVVKDVTWTLGQGQRTAAEALILDHGRLHLDGGVINIGDVYLYNGSRLDGSGWVGETWHSPDSPSQYSTVYVEDGGTVHPGKNGLDFTGRLELGDHGILALDVSPTLENGSAPIRFGLYGEYSVDPDSRYSVQSWLNVKSESALLALNVTPGFYDPGKKYELVGLSTNRADQIGNFKKAGMPIPRKGLLGGYWFEHLARSDVLGRAIDGYTVDLTALDPHKHLFHPFDNSLISYNLIQQDNGIWLRANNAFTDPSLCGNRGCGLGTALSAAAQSSDRAWEPLLGALEFSTTDQAARAAKQLRGETYGSLRTSTLSLLGAFNTTLNEHLRAVDPAVDQTAQLALAAGAYGMGLDSAHHTADLSAMMRYLVASDETAAAAQSPDKFKVWARLFGQRGRLYGGDGADGLREHSSGVMFGLDRQLNPGTVLGGSVGYGKLRANGEDGNGFRGQVKATDARLYVDHRYDHGYLDASVSFTHLRNSTTRAIQLPLYSAQARAQYGGNAWSLHFEHGKTFQDHHGVVWQPILPSIDVTRLPAMQFADRGAGPANLQVDGKRRFDPRVGVGLQVAKTFAWGTHGKLTPHARVLFQHRFINNEHEFVANLQGDPSHPFDVASQQEDANHTLIDAGLSARRGEHTAFMLDYVSDYARRHHDQGVMLGVSHRW